MDNNEIQLVGGPCGQHGPYTFYKAFKYTKNGVKRIVTLSEFFFVKLWIDSDLLCIGELQLLWCDKNSDQVLASLRLYFLPENTPEGRMDHGEDEVLAISEKVVLRVEDLITWITVDAEWTWGRLAKCEREVKDPPPDEDTQNVIGSLAESSLDFSDVERERKASDCYPEQEGPTVIILSYPRYCRYRAMMRRLEGLEDEFLKYKIVSALGGLTAYTNNTRILFCKDTFDYPELEGHELLCNHLAPKLKGRPRGKRKKRSISPGSESNESESSISNVFNSSKEKITAEGGRNGLRCDSGNLRRSTRSTENSESKEFIKELTVFMKTNYTPIGRIPSLGYKELDLHSFYTKVQKLGGYDSVTANRLWKSIFDDMSGHQNSTSAATVVRRHYERFLLPYERHVKGEEYKPLPVSERRRLKCKAGSSASDPETSESTSRSGNSTPIPQTPVTPTTPTESKEFNIQIKAEGKTSSLRSVRVKLERQKDKQSSSDKFNNNNINEIETSPTIKDDVFDDDNSISKADVKTEADIKSELVNMEIVSLADKHAEPLTSAVAPVAQKLPPEKSHSPVEGKENVPIIKTGDTPSTNSKSPDVLEVPYKPKSPEIIDLETDTYKSTTTSLTQPFLHEVKKRKLEILKEGGLEVTPVRPFVSPLLTKDVRPSVIQQAGAQVSPKAVSNDIHNMPPPSINSVPPKRLHLSVPQTLNISQIPVSPNQTAAIHTPPIASNQFTYPTASLPPKVVQSKSIYSYSERTVYGNPKDFSVPSPNKSFQVPNHVVHTPKFVSPPRLAGGDILDLTVTSPQKPAVEVMKMPPTSGANHLMPPFNMRENPRMYHKSPPATNANLLDGRRLGSNLEITLVGPNGKPPGNHQGEARRYSLPPPQYHQNSNRYTQKRGPLENYYNQKIPRLDSSKYLKPVMSHPVTSRESEITVPQPYGRSSSMKSAPTPPPMKPPPQTPQPKLYPPTPAPAPYPLSLYEANKMPYLPILDPLYYSAMQSLYSQSAMNATPPVLPFPSTEQLKFYTELMAHNSRFGLPFGADGNSSIVNFKKP